MTLQSWSLQRLKQRDQLSSASPLARELQEPPLWGRPCKPLELENGRVHLTSFRFGATANFSCSEGYKLIGRTSAQCVLVKNGVDWDQEAPFCKAIPCLPPPDITHGSHNALSGEEFFFGLKVTYKCDQGFSLIGEASIHCTMKDNVKGEWSGPAPECKVVKCPEPEVKNGKKHSGFGPDYSYGNIVIFECDSGYTLKGSSSVKCEANNSWVPSLPTCLRILHTSPSGGIKDTSARSCPHPGKPENGRLVVLTDLMFGATINFICEEGYRLIGHAQRKCVLEGSHVKWDKDIPYCQLIACLPPPEIEHGTHTGTTMEEFNYGTSVTYQCNTVERGQVPFSLIGEPSINCTSTDNVNGDWSGPAPECKVVRCEQPRVDHGKQMTGYSPVYTYGASVLFECDHRYTLKGSNVLHCNENSRWDPQLPVCERSVIW
ncbi:complement receptor type 2-like isoform X1 [Malaclemys terrapin pileata]|uniref:complement receptor type 2-like isoform X1 n=1 Tax=Malaclemys terrapin pileata TaxID=2991368 RepID=UPI0023A81329|nr:complement receptor type 2-like isoform X1 [Malaclemys terrapin pileata]